MSRCFFTLTLQKSRMLQIQGAEGEAIVGYCEPSATQEIRYHRLSRRVKNMAVFSLFVDFTVCAFVNNALQRCNILLLWTFLIGCHVFYATLGFSLLMKISKTWYAQTQFRQVFFHVGIAKAAALSGFYVPILFQLMIWEPLAILQDI